MSSALALVACPSCPVSRQVFSAVWYDDFLPNLLVTVLPFLVIIAVCLRAEEIGR